MQKRKGKGSRKKKKKRKKEKLILSIGNVYEWMVFIPEINK